MWSVASFRNTEAKGAYSGGSVGFHGVRGDDQLNGDLH